MKILYVYGNLPAYRKEFFSQLSEKAKANDIVIKVLYGYIANKETKQATDFSFLAQKFETRTVNLKIFRLSRMKGILRQIKLEQPDGVIFQWNQTNLSEWAILRYCKKRHIPYGMWGCNYTRSDLIRPLVSIRENIYRKLYRKAAVLVPYGSLYKKYLLNLGIDNDKIVVAQNTIDVESISKNCPKRTVESFSHETVRILYVGALAPQKRIDSAIDAVAQLISEGVDLSFKIVGNGQILEKLKLQLSEKSDSVRERITFYGAKYGSELMEFYMNSDAFLMPGTGGLGVNEAMAYGLPIISTKGDETIYDLIDGNGYLLDRMGSVDEQKAAIRKFAALTAADKYYMSQNSIKHILDKAPLRKMVENHLLSCRILINSNK